MKTLAYMLAWLLGAALPWSAADANDSRLTVDRAVAIAIEQDPWLTGSHHREDALESEAVAAAQLPDPKVDLTAANLPTDSFDRDQEAMTQISVGLSQTFPRGDSLALAGRRKEQLAERQPLLRLDRRAKVAATVSRLWLDVYRAQESIRLIENDRELFEHLVDAADAKYSAAVKRTRQHELIRAQLELSRLDERLAALRQTEDTARRQLAEWVGDAAEVALPAKLPSIEPAAFDLSTDHGPPLRQDWYERIRMHPAVLATERDIDASRTQADLARQKYKPEWGVSARYGYREDDPTGRRRSDLFSAGLTFDLPIFTGKRQDKEVAAAVYRAEEARTERSLLVRKLVAELGEARAKLDRLDQRRQIYDHRLLPQMHDQAEASLTAYYNDDGDFAEAIRARIDELNARVDALTIRVARLQTIARLNYLLTQAPPSQINEGIEP